MTDIKAVGPGRWNGWKNTLLTKLYHRAEEILSGGHQVHDLNDRVTKIKALLYTNLKNWAKNIKDVNNTQKILQSIVKNFLILIGLPLTMIHIYDTQT